MSTNPDIQRSTIEWTEQPKNNWSKKIESTNEIIKDLWKRFQNINSLVWENETDAWKKLLEDINKYLQEKYPNTEMRIESWKPLLVTPDTTKVLTEIMEEIKNPSGNNINALFEKNFKESSYLWKEFMSENPDGTFTVDFKWNEKAESKIWLSDLLPEKVKKVTITTESWNNITWFRQWLKWWFYTEQGKYIAVFSGDKVKIEEKYNDEELNALKQENDQKILNILNSDKIKQLYASNGIEDPVKKENISKIIWKSIEHNIDPNITLSVLDINNLSNVDNETIIMSMRRFQTTMNNFKNIEWKDPIDNENWHYNLNFLYYAQNYLKTSWISSPDTKDVIKQYWKLIWKEFTEEQLDWLEKQFAESQIWKKSNFGPVTRWYESFDPQNLDYVEWPSTIPSFETLINWKWSVFKPYEETIKQVCNNLKVPPQVLLQLFIKEWSNWNPNACPWNSTARWFGQIIDSTWNYVTDNLAPRYWVKENLARLNADHQIIWAAILLRNNFDRNWKTRENALVVHHTWSLKFSDSQAQKYASLNPAVAKHVNWQINTSSYIEWTKKYFLSA